MRESVSSIMRQIAECLETPVIILLVILIAVSLILLGTLIVEGITERRKLKVNMPELADKLKEPGADVESCIRNSGLLRAQKTALIELTKHPDLTNDMREALALRLNEEASAKFEKRLYFSDLLAKLGPILGLMGTLIPLGPGVIALGQGNTYVLSQSLLTAFDTTILGLCGAAVCMIISSIRKRWYRDYMSILGTLTECVLEVTQNKESIPETGQSDSFVGGKYDE